MSQSFLEISAQIQTRRLGDVSGKSSWASVNAPLEVIKAASSVLTGDPASWTVNNNLDFASQGQHVVCLTDSNGEPFICLVTGDKWIRLNEREGIPYISEIMKNYLHSDDFKNPDRLADYLQYVAYLYKGPFRIVLSKSFLNRAKDDLGVWLAGREKNASAFSSLCVNPIPISHGDGFSIAYNVITNFGAVEAWNLDLKVGRASQISKITVHQIHEKGTFSYGLVGG